MKIKFNPKKCKVMHISRKKLPNKHHYNLDGQPLEQVTNIKALGITVSSNLSWSKHIEVTAAKANKTLGLIKRICRDIPVNDCATRRLLYCFLVPIIQAIHRSRHYDENNFYFITKHKQDYFRNSFFVRSANLWNSLITQLKSCTSISVFSSRLRIIYKERLLFYSPPGCS
jgi:hypothetical protein